MKIVVNRQPLVTSKHWLSCFLRGFIAFSLLYGVLPMINVAHAVQPIVTDSRIKTFVYNPNEVFALTTHYGYQSNIEFAERETIDTVSVGDRVAWQIIPAGRRLFIRAMEENAHTNMTIVTNQHAYQFDLRSSASDAVFGSAELTYVVRFFYPDAANTRSSAISMASPDFTPPAPIAAGYTQAPAPQVIAPPSPSPAIPATSGANRGYNYRYTYSGSSDVAPTKIFDDGKSTYFRFKSGNIPKVSVISTQGQQLDVPTRRLSDNMVAVDVIAPSFSLKQSGSQVIVYNEAGGA